MAREAPKAFHESGQFVIEVVDDGAGIHPDRLRRKAIEKGVLRETDVLTDQQAVDARSKRGKDGKFLYESDPKYRQWYDKTLARSNVFL